MFKIYNLFTSSIYCYLFIMHFNMYTLCNIYVPGQLHITPQTVQNTIRVDLTFRHNLLPSLQA